MARRMRRAAAITKDRAQVQESIKRTTSEVTRQALAMADVYQHRMEALNESFKACHQTVEQVRRTLQILLSQFNDFRAEIGDRKDETSASEWLKQVKSRLKLGLNKPRIEKAIQNLRDFNGDFGLITEQITKALQEIANESEQRPTVTRKSVHSLSRLQTYHRVRYASKALYFTLQAGWNCKSHHRHYFDVRIIERDSCERSVDRLTTSYITCELAIRHDDLPNASKTPPRLEIEQAYDLDNEAQSPMQPAEENADMQQLSSILETNVDRFRLDSPASTPTKPSIIQKGFQKIMPQQTPVVPAAFLSQSTTTSNSVTNLRIDSPHSEYVAAISASDLSLVDDLCRKIDQDVTQCRDRSPLGFWKGPRAQWFRVATADEATQSTSQSISDFVRWISEEPLLRSLPRSQLIELAENVAEGIMQFYSTPWLAPTTLGQNVRVFRGAEMSSSTVALEGPYFMAQLETVPTKGKANAVSACSIPSDGPVEFEEARNKLLFQFGILLLEIGYGQPWHDLKQKVSRTPWAASGNLSNYQAAEKLAQSLVNQMGLTYPKIIRKCLGCDFGLGETDLDNEDLQGRFLDDVVSGLQQLKKQMKDMDLS